MAAVTRLSISPKPTCSGEEHRWSDEFGNGAAGLDLLIQTASRRVILPAGGTRGRVSNFRDNRQRDRKRKQIRRGLGEMILSFSWGFQPFGRLFRGVPNHHSVDPRRLMASPMIGSPQEDYTQGMTAEVCSLPGLSLRLGSPKTGFGTLIVDGTCGVQSSTPARPLSPASWRRRKFPDQRRM